MKWTYSKYRATLYLDGERFALVSPNGKDALSDDDASRLLAALNFEDTNGVAPGNVYPTPEGFVASWPTLP